MYSYQDICLHRLFSFCEPPLLYPLVILPRPCGAGGLTLPFCLAAGVATWRSSAQSEYSLDPIHSNCLEICLVPKVS